MKSAFARRALAASALLAIVVAAVWWLHARPRDDARRRDGPADISLSPASRPGHAPLEGAHGHTATVASHDSSESRAASLPTHPGQPLPPPGTPLVLMFDSLKTLAEQGDARAACRLAFELDRCRKIDLLRKAPAVWREAAKQSPVPVSEEETARRVAESESRLAQAETACKDVSGEQMLAAWDYGLAAALAGNREARWLVSFFPVGLDYNHPENTLEGWAEWRRYIPRIMQEGVEAGDPRMFQLAGRAYLMPTLGYRVYPQDAIRGTALMMALQAGASPAYRDAATSGSHFWMDRFGLSEDEVRRARALAATLPPLTQLPAGGYDWSRGMAPDSDGSACEKP
ncbi:MAG TPA: hypothetical protein VFP44_02915 [Usitatibacter sp.]|nr:hypothetical protein [Usitatibacter sp.]